MFRDSDNCVQLSIVAGKQNYNSMDYNSTSINILFGGFLRNSEGHFDLVPMLTSHIDVATDAGSDVPADAVDDRFLLCLLFVVSDYQTFA